MRKGKNMKRQEEVKNGKKIKDQTQECNVIYESKKLMIIKEGQMRISNRLRNEIKLNAPAYRIALKAGIHHSTLSKLMCGIEIIKPNDQRVIAVGKVLGVPAEECFEETAKKALENCQGYRCAGE